MVRKLLLMCIPFCLILLAILSACGTPGNGSAAGASASPTAAASTTTTQPTTAPTTVTTAQPTTASTTTTPGQTQQYAFTAQDSGRTVTYGLTDRFSIALDQQKYPRQNLQLSCQPQGALGSISNTPYAAPPLYAVSYETVTAGHCTIEDGSFILTVIILDTTTPTPATPTPQPQDWKIYQTTAFTLRYPAGWSVNVIPSGPAGGIYMEQVEFRLTPASAVSFMVSALYNNQVSPDTLLHNDPLYQSCTINSQSKVTINGILWSTASGTTRGPQLGPAQVTIAYANHKHPYRIEFGAPPDQFAAYAQTFNAMFQSFQER